MSVHNYFIKEGYKHKTVAPTATANGSTYWNDARLESSKYYQYSVYRYAARLMRKHKLTSCIDIGCGSGYKLATIIAPVATRVVGVDQPFVIERCQTTYPQLEWHSVNLEHDVPETIGQFDIVLSIDVIEHLLQPEVLVASLKKRAHDHSYIIISTPERDILHGTDNFAAKNPEHIREWNQTEFRNFLTHEGLTVLEMRTEPPLPFHWHRRYFSYLKHHFWRRNFCMMAVCQKTANPSNVV